MRTYKKVALLLSLVNVSSALAANTMPINTSLATPVAPTKSGVSDWLGISYFGQMTGPALGELNTPTSVLHAADQYGEAVQMNLYNDLRVDFKTGGIFKIRVSTRFEVLPLSDALNPNETDYFNMLDSRVGLVGTLLDNGKGFTLGSQFMAQLPVSASSAASGMVFSPRVMLNPDYVIPQSRWNVGSYLVAQTYYYNSFSSANTASNDLYFYFGPYSNYKINSKWSGTLQLNVDTTHARNAPYTYSSFIVQGTNAQLGANVDISKNFSLNPFFQVPIDNPQLRTTFLGAYISAKFL